MILKDLLNLVEDNELLKYLYEKGEENNLLSYEKMLGKLRKMQPKFNEENRGLKIVVLEEKDLFSEEEIFVFDVFGVVEGSEDSYALEFMDWNLWLGSEVVSKSVDKYGNVCFVAECLYEMSFISFEEEEIKEEIDELKKREESILDGTATTFSFEEVLEHLEIDDYKEPTEEEKEINRKKIEERHLWNTERRKEILS